MLRLIKIAVLWNNKRFSNFSSSDSFSRQFSHHRTVFFSHKFVLPASDITWDFLPPSDRFFVHDPLGQFYPILPTRTVFPANFTTLGPGFFINFTPPRTAFFTNFTHSDSLFWWFYPPRTFSINSVLCGIRHWRISVNLRAFSYPFVVKICVKMVNF